MYWSLVPGIMFPFFLCVCFFGAQLSPCSWQLVLASLEKKRHNPWVFKELVNSNGFRDFEVKKDRTHHQIKMMWTYNYYIFLHYLYLWYTAVGYALHSHRLHLERLNPLSSHVMFHAVTLHPKLQIGTTNGLVSVCWNVQQETWCQHNFNLESVLSWLVPARDVKIWLVVSNISSLDPYLGKWSNLTNIFQMAWNHQLEIVYIPLFGYMHSNSIRISSFTDSDFQPKPAKPFTWQVILLHIPFEYPQIRQIQRYPNLRYESLDLLGNFADNHDEWLALIWLIRTEHLEENFDGNQHQHFNVVDSIERIVMFCVVCLLGPNYRVDVFVLNELERVLSSWTKRQDFIEKQQHTLDIE